MREIRAAAAAALLVMAALAGCASRLPLYPPMSDPDALALIAERQSVLRSLSAQCDLTLTDADGQIVSLDAVMIVIPPERIRIRAWKLGQAVFDLTLDGQSVWMMMPEEGLAAGRFDESAVPAAYLKEAVNLLGPAFYRSAHIQGHDGVTLVAKGRGCGRDDIVCEIDRRTLTARRFRIPIAGSDIDVELVLDRYDLVSDLPWPKRISLHSPAGDIVLRFRELDLNGEVPVEAFVPPRRARSVP